MGQPPMSRHAQAMLWVTAFGLLAACTHAPPQEVATRAHFPALEAARIPPPPEAEKGTCWARDTTPAVIETVTAQIIEQPAILNEGGSVRSPAIYATETRQEIVEPRREHVFETLCAGRITPGFIASLQRALQARGLYDGPITGLITPDTEAALRNYQRAQGVETGLLTIRTARELGLVAVPRF